MISKGTPRGCKTGFVLICWVDLNFIVSREPIHKEQCLLVDTIIDYLVDEGGWEVVFGISMVDVAKVCADMNSSLFFVNEDRVGDPRSVCNGVNELDNM
jgi:hypothetical protein